MMKIAHRSLSPEYTAVEDMLTCLKHKAQGQGWHEQHVYKLTLCMAELLNNILKHTPSTVKEPISLYYLLNPYQFVANIEHRSASYFFCPPEMPEPTAEGGRGLALVHEIADQVVYQHYHGVNRLFITLLLPEYHEKTNSFL